MENEIDDYLESLIVFGGELTSYGLSLYSQEVYIRDEDNNEVRIIKEDYSKE